MYMATGAHLKDVDGLRQAGYARLYAKSGTDWNMIQQINGTQSPGYFGFSLDLSHDGSLLTVISSGGSVYMYQLSKSSFLYELLYFTDDIYAGEVCVSGDGMVVGVTTLQVPSSNNTTGVRIFERVGDVFQERNTDILNYGYSSGGIALNYEGTIAVIGDYAWSTFEGRAAVFQWRDYDGDGSMEWIQMGSNITSNAGINFYWFGDYGCISITYDGLTIAVGMPYYNRDGLSWRGLVRVYNYDSTSDTWKHGTDLVGDNSFDEFSKTALSANGTYLAVGASGGNYGDNHYVKVFAKIGNNYEPVGDTIIGEAEGDRFGFSVDMSADGSALAISDVLFDNRGKVYLYDTVLSSPLTSASSSPPIKYMPYAKSSTICLCLLFSCIIW